MDTSSEQALITSLHQHRLGLTSLLSSPSAKRVSEMREEMETPCELSQPTDTAARPAVVLAWALAMQAQSCAYLALELQEFAEQLLTSQIMCQESTYRRLSDSIEIFTRLLESMRRSYAENNSHETDNSMPVLSEHLVEVIRFTLAQGQATTTDGSTINTERAARKSTESVGDTK